MWVLVDDAECDRNDEEIIILAIDETAEKKVRSSVIENQTSNENEVVYTEKPMQ